MRQRYAPIRKSLVRFDLLFGCERILLVPALIISGLMFVIFKLYFKLIAVSFLFASVHFLRKIAIKDPQLTSKYMRLTKYKTIYWG